MERERISYLNAREEAARAGDILSTAQVLLNNAVAYHAEAQRKASLAATELLESVVI